MRTNCNVRRLPCEVSWALFERDGAGQGKSNTQNTSHVTHYCLWLLSVCVCVYDHDRKLRPLELPEKRDSIIPKPRALLPFFTFCWPRPNNQEQKAPCHNGHTRGTQWDNAITAIFLLLLCQPFPRPGDHSGQGSETSRSGCDDMGRGWHVAPILQQNARKPKRTIQDAINKRDKHYQSKQFAPMPALPRCLAIICPVCVCVLFCAIFFSQPPTPVFDCFG